MAEKTISERIEDAATEALCNMRIPKTIFLGKAEMAQYHRENPDRIVLEGSPVGESRKSLWTSYAVVEIKPSDADSEFRLETDVK